MFLLHRLLVPLLRLGVVLLHALAMIVHETQIVLSPCVSLLRRLLVPLPCLGVVLLHALAIFVHVTQIELSIWESLLSCLSKQALRFIHLPLLLPIEGAPRQLTAVDKFYDGEADAACIIEHFLRGRRQLRAA